MTEQTGSSPVEQPEPSDKWYRKVTAWRFIAAVFGIATAVLILLLVKQAVELHGRYTITNWGNVAEALGAAGTLLAVAVALWQSIVIRRQAQQEAKDAADRLERELKAADKRHKAELDAQREIARVQRLHQREQEFKLALIRVSRAASAYIHELATLVAETPRIVTLPTRQERDDALKPISKQLGALALDLSAEISGAHMLTNNDQLHDALDVVNDAALKGPRSEIDYRNSAVWEGQVPNQAPIFMVMDELPRVIGDARRLAGELLVTRDGTDTRVRAPGSTSELGIKQRVASQERYKSRHVCSACLQP